MPKILVFIIISFSYLSGCGYTIGDLIPHQTISVLNFHNETLYREYEFLFTEAIISEISLRTPMHVTKSLHADTVLSGKICEIKGNTVRKDEERRAEELDIVVAVEIDWKDCRNNKFILRKKKVSETVQIVISRGENFDTAITEALHKLARSVVYVMEHPYWNTHSTTSASNKESR